MLSIQSPSSSNKPQECTPNLLPARLNHDGRIDSTQRYWTPEKDEAGKSHAYFRGRHLHGTTIALPENYTGAVLKVTDRKAVDTQNAAGKVGEEDEEEDEDGDMVDVSIAEKVGEFDEVIVWGHGGAVDEREDVYARGIREWTRFAEAMHAEEEGDEEEGDAEEKKTG